MGFIGDADPVTNLTGAETFPVVVGTALKEITTANAAVSTIFAEAIRDVMGSALVAGSGVTVTVNDAGDTITIATSGAAAYTDEQVRDVMGTALIAGSGISIAVSDAGDTITITAGIGTTYTDENARDAIAAALIGEPNYLVVTPNDAADSITVSIDPTFKAKVESTGPGTLVHVNDSGSSAAAAVHLPGVSGSWVTTPDSAALDIIGDLEIVVRVALDDWTAATSQGLVSKWDTTGNQRSYVFFLNATTGMPQLSISVNGTAGSNAVATTAPTVTDGSALWLRVRRTSATGSVDFHTAPDQDTEPTSWTALTLNRTTTAGAMFASTAVGGVGAYTAGTSAFAAGNVYRALVKNGLSGTVVADFNPASWVSGTTWVSTTGETWSLQGTAAMVGGVSTATSNTTAQFTLADNPAYPAVGLAIHDTLLWFTNFALINTSGSAANYTFVVKVNGTTLFSVPVQSLTSAAASVRTGMCALRLDMNAGDGSSVAASMEFNIANAVTGTGAGSGTCATDLVRLTGNLTTSISAFNTVPTIALLCTMGTAATTISAQRGFTQLYIAKA